RRPHGAPRDAARARGRQALPRGRRRAVPQRAPARAPRPREARRARGREARLRLGGRTGGRDGLPPPLARDRIQPPRGRAPHRPHAPDPRPPRAPGAPGPGRCALRGFRPEPPPSEARVEADVPARGLDRLPASDHAGGHAHRVRASRGPRELPRPLHGAGAPMSRYDLVVFDWDGTLMDSTRLIASCLQDACRDVGAPVPTEAEALFVIGLNMADTFKRVVPDLDEDGRRRLAERYRHHFLAREHEAPLYEGVREMLAELHGGGRRLAVATGKARRGLDRALDAT